MTDLEILEVLQQHGAVQKKILESAALLFAEPKRQCSSELEMLINHQGWVAQVTVADALSIEFSASTDDQRIAVDLLRGLVYNESYVVIEHRRKWFVSGSLGSAAKRHRWSGWSIDRKWCPWVDGKKTTGEFLALRIA